MQDSGIVDRFTGLIGGFVGGIVDQPVVQIALAAIGAYVTLVWLACAWWAFQDMRRRTANVAEPYLAAGIVILATPVLFPAALVVYTILRPARTVAETRRLALETLLTETEEIRSICPACARPVEETWLACPRCRTGLAYLCASCGRTIGRDWDLCAWCGAEFGAAAPRPIRHIELQPVMDDAFVAAAARTGRLEPAASPSSATTVTTVAPLAIAAAGEPPVVTAPPFVADDGTTLLSDPGADATPKPAEPVEAPELEEPSEHARVAAGALRLRRARRMRSRADRDPEAARPS